VSGKAPTTVLISRTNSGLGLETARKVVFQGDRVFGTMRDTEGRNAGAKDERACLRHRRRSRRHRSGLGRSRRGPDDDDVVRVGVAPRGRKRDVGFRDQGLVARDLLDRLAENLGVTRNVPDDRDARLQTGSPFVVGELREWLIATLA
jgi:hypothetical protein